MQLKELLTPPKQLDEIHVTLQRKGRLISLKTRLLVASLHDFPVPPRWEGLGGGVEEAI